MAPEAKHHQHEAAIAAAILDIANVLKMEIVSTFSWVTTFQVLCHLQTSIVKFARRRALTQTILSSLLYNCPSYPIYMTACLPPPDL